MSTTYRADWVFTGEGEPIRDGVVTVWNGQIVSVKPWRWWRRASVDLGQVLITPGFVNAHTHLDLGALHNKLPAPAQFTDWLRQVVAYRRQGNVAEWDAAIQAGITESNRAGTAWLTDISVGGRSLPMLEQAPILYEVCLELIGMSDERITQAMDQAKSWWRDSFKHSAVSQMSISPHAPYTVGKPLLERLIDELRDAHISMHLAETREELELLQSHSGPLRSFLEEMGAWYPANLFRSIDDVIELLQHYHQTTKLIHCNYLTREQWQHLPDLCQVVYCPRTHAYFGHEPHPYLQMLEDRVEVALGTDSLASNPDLSILNEARFLWQRDRRHLTGPTLLRLASGWLRLNQHHHFVVIPHDNSTADPWDLLFSGTASPSATYLNGMATWQQ